MSPADLEGIHERLKAILREQRGELAVSADGPGGMTLEVPGLEGKPWGYVAGTRLGKRYVSYYLMPVYAQPALESSISPALAKRRQGKSCFNFATVDEPLFAELGRLTATAIDRWPDEARRLAAERAR
jgi:hypothetical protein